MDDILRAINDNQSFLITSHRSPDGDSIGSCIALGLALKKLGKRVTYVMDSIPIKFEFLSDTGMFKENVEQSRQFQVGFFLDCSNEEHLFDSSLLSNCCLKVNLDHHVTNTQYGDINYIDSSASAAGEIVYKLITKLNTPIDEDIANALYTAIVTDTGNFKYSNVTGRTHLIMSELYKYSHSLSEVNMKIFDENTFEKIKIIGKAIDKLYLIDGKISVIYLSLDDLKNLPEDEDTEGIINCARSVKGVEVAIFIKETDKDVYKVSLRSKNHYDVSKLAAYYGGGGHSKAAGYTIKTDLPEKIIDDIVNRIKSEL